MFASRGLIFVALSTVLSVSAPAMATGDYCLALRGNGDAQPAHWGALANVVEKEGLPRMQAGGSSATISLFLLDGIAQNPLVTSLSGPRQNQRAALMLKSLYGIARELGEAPEAQAGLGVLRVLEVDKFEALKAFAEGLNVTTLAQEPMKIAALVKLAQEMRSFGIGDAPRYAFLIDVLEHPLALSNLSPQRLNQARFYAGELHRAITTLGAFDAESDPDLFFRDGIVNFKKFGASVGRVATFLSGRAWDVATRSAYHDFLALCEPLQTGLTWQELAAREPRCQDLLGRAFQAYFRQSIDWSGVNLASGPLGAKIPTLATTAVLTNSAYRTARATYQAYHRNLDRSVSSSFKIARTDDVRFGYWGPSDVLAKIRSRLSGPFTDRQGRRFDFSDDVKRSKFLPLGSATWSEVLRLSPAEPGLASLQPMKVAGRDAYSAGGWSDLHPIPVLKAAGCERVIYVTRKGGESLFGQGIAKRVFNLDRGWDELRTKTPDDSARNGALNNLGDTSDLTSMWSRLYNVANPKSSYMRAVAAADAVLCTDWDRFDSKTQLSDLVTESYQAPYVAPVAPLRTSLEAAGAKIIDQPMAMTEGKPEWPGCRPPSAQ